MNARKLEPDHLARLCAGDPAAEREVIGHFDRLLRIKVRLRSRGRNQQHVEDVVQETFARAFAALRGGRVQQILSFGAFVNRVCENVAHEMERSEGRWTTMADPPERSAPDNPEAETITREGLHLADELLAALPARDRDILWCLLVEEQDKDEVCRRFHVTRDHLRVILHRAKERFRGAGAGPRNENG